MNEQENSDLGELQDLSKRNEAIVPPVENTPTQGVQAQSNEQDNESLVDAILASAINNQDVEIVIPPLEEVEKACAAVEAEIPNIDIHRIAVEAIRFAAQDAENYIDTKDSYFNCHMYPSTDSRHAELMPSVKKLQDMYKGIPEIPSELNVKEMSPQEERVTVAIDRMNAVVDKLKALLLDREGYSTELKEAMDYLFQKVIYFYEVVSISRSGVVTIDWDGYIDIQECIYDTMSIQMEVFKKHKGQKVLDHIVDVPAALVMGFEIVKWKKQQPSFMM